MKKGRKKKKAFLDVMCEQLIHENTSRVGKQSTESALEELNRVLNKIREWSGDLSTVPDGKLIQMAESAILNASWHVRPTSQKKRTLNQAVRVLDQRRKGLGVGAALEELKSRVKALVSGTKEPQLFQIYQQALVEKAEGIMNKSAERRRQFLQEIKKYKANSLKKKQWDKNQQAVFEDLIEFMPDPHDKNLREQVPQMILAYLHWLDRFETPLGEIFRFLAKAGLWQPQKIDAFLEKRRSREKKRAIDRVRWKTNKARSRARKTQT
jgi:hypothetical protein